jgi:hypothetical protein
MYKSGNNSRVIGWKYSEIFRQLTTALDGVPVVVALEVPRVYFSTRGTLPRRDVD